MLNTHPRTCAVIARCWTAGFASPKPQHSPWQESPGCFSDWVGAHLQLGPLDPAHAACRVPPGVLGSVDQLRIPQLVRVSGLNLLGHLLQPLHVGLGAGSGKVGSRGGGEVRQRAGNAPALRLEFLVPTTPGIVGWLPQLWDNKDQGERTGTCAQTQQTPGMKLYSGSSC